MAVILLIGLLGLLVCDARRPRSRRAARHNSTSDPTVNGLRALASKTTDADLQSRQESRPADVEFNPRLLVRQCANRFAALVHSKGLRLKVVVAPGTPLRVRGNKARIRTIICSLLNNAVKFTDEGVVRLEAKLGEECGGPPQLRFDVYDTGAGIDSETLARVLGPEDPGKSTAGHGLSTARRMLTSLGGNLGAESEPRGGSTFWFSVPVDIVEPALAAPPNAPVRASYPGSLLPRPVQPGKRILIVEQDPASQVAVLLGVRMLGYSGEVVCSTQDALRSWQRWPFALALLDCTMADAGETMRAIRGLETGCVPIVGMSAVADGEPAFGAAIDGRLTKPVCLLELAHTLDHWLGDAAPGYAGSDANSDKLSLPV